MSPNIGYIVTVPTENCSYGSIQLKTDLTDYCRQKNTFFIKFARTLFDIGGKFASIHSDPPYASQNKVLSRMPKNFYTVRSYRIPSLRYDESRK